MKKIIITLALLFSIVENSYSQWKPTNGPYGGSISALSVADNGNIYAGTWHGVFLSTNNGDNWSTINSGLSNLNIRRMATSGSYIYAGTYGGGIFKSTNNGDSWFEINKGLKFKFVTGIVVSENIVYVSVDDGTDNAISYSSSIYSSTDFGENWNEIDIGSNNRSERIRKMSISGNNLVLGLGLKLLISSDKGLTWENMFFGTNSYINYLANIGDTIIVGAQYSGLHLSTDNGKNWKEINNGISSYYFNCIIATKKIVFVSNFDGLFKSTDYGENWIEVKNGLIDNDILSLAISDSILYAGSSSGGVYASSDNGENWESKNNGLTNGYVSEMTTLDNYIFASTGDGIFKSLKNSNEWTEANNGLTKNNVRMFTKIGKNIIAGTLDEGILLSSNSGESWNESNSGLSNKMILCLDNDGENIYAGTNGGGLFFSSDTGKSWKSLMKNLQDTVILSLSVNGENIYLISDDRGILLSSDYGSNWKEFNFPYYDKYLEFIQFIDNKVFVIERGSLYLSIDNMKNWKPIKYSSTINYNPYNFVLLDNFLILSEHSEGVFISTNYGETWHVANNGLTNKFIRSLAILDNIIYAGTWGGGVFQANINDFFSSVSGRVLEDGMPLANITISSGSSTVTSDANGNFTFSDLVVGEQEITPHASGYSFTPSSYKINLSNDTTGLVFNAEKVISSLEIGDNKSFIKSIYPQPSDSKLQISLEATIADEIKIYSIDGVEIYKQVFTKLTDYLEIDTNSLPSGAYILELSTQHGKETQNVLIQK